MLVLGGLFCKGGLVVEGLVLVAKFWGWCVGLSCAFLGLLGSLLLLRRFLCRLLLRSFLGSFLALATSQKTISGPKNVSYDAQLCPIIVKSPSAPSAQATHQIANKHYEEAKSSCPDSQTLKNFF